MPRDLIGSRTELEPVEQESYVPAVVSSYAVPQPVEAPGDSVGLDELAAALWRRKWIVVGTALLGLIGGLAVSLVITPTYRARASLQLEGLNNDPSLPISPSVPNASAENYLQNEVKVLESETLANRLADTLGIHPEDQPPGLLSALRNRLADQLGFSPLRAVWPARMTPAERRTKEVQKALTVRTSLQSQVIEVFYDAPDPNLAARGANGAVSEFINMNRQARWQLAQDTTEWLDRQARELKAAVDSSNQQLEAFAHSSGLVFAGQQSTLAQDRMRQIQDALAKAEADRAAKQARYETAEQHPDEIMSDALATGPLRQYQTDLQNLRRELAQLQAIYTPTNIKVQKVQAQIAEAESAIEKERTETIGRLRNDYLAAAGLERLLSIAQTVQLKTVEQQMGQERRYDVKKSEIEATEKLYESMLEKVKEAGAASALRATNVRMIDSASVPSIPYSPNPPLNMALGLALGVLGGFALVLVREGPAKVKRPGESILAELPELGVIPSARNVRALEPARNLGARGIRQLGLVNPGRETSLLAESFRAALTSILFNASFDRGAAHPGSRVLVVTSIDVMEGKTTILTNLGIAAAERKQRVLLIDADLRRPRVHELAGVPNTWGLADVLAQSDLADFADTAPLDALVRETRIPGLWVMPGGSVNAAVSSLLYSADLTVLLERFRRAFDLVLIDTPPIMLYADARVMGRISDGVILVVRANTKSRDELRSAHRKLRQDQIPVLGTILNDWKMDSGQIRTYNRYHDHYRSRPA